MATLLHVLNHDVWLSGGRDLAIKATLLLIVAALVAEGLWRSSAALRHRVWGLAFAALLLLPIVGGVLPGLPLAILPSDWRAAAAVDEPATASDQTSRQNQEGKLVGVGPAGQPRATPAPGDESSRAVELMLADPATETERSTAIAPAGNANPGEQTRPAKSLLVWLPAIWLTGTLLALLPLACGLWGNRRLRRRSAPLTDPRWHALRAELSARLNLTREVRLLLADAGQMPMTFGWKTPYVVLPADALDWPEERRRVVLLHELAHVKRFDVPWQMVARVASALYWFHPLVWWGLRRMRTDREQACDDCVLAAGQRASTYATHLLEIARAHHPSSPLASAALSMARRSQLEGRLLAVLDARRTRGAIGRNGAIGLAMSAIAAVAILAVIRPVLREEAMVLAAGNDPSNAAATTPAETSDGSTVVTGRILSPQGQPVAGALVELLAMESNTGWPVYRPLKQTIDYETATTDNDGRYRIALPKRPLGIYPALWLFASAAGFPACQIWLTPRDSVHEVEIQLDEPKTVRVQLIDSIGNPVADVLPRMCGGHSERKGGETRHTNFWLPDAEARALVKSWPTWTASDDQGFTTAQLAGDLRDVQLLVDDETFGCQILPAFKTADDAVAVVVQRGLEITGSVVAADTLEPLAGALVRLIERPYMEVRTRADGRFHLRSALNQEDPLRDRDVRLNVYPPADSPYLFQCLRQARPGYESGGSMGIAIKLERGIVVEGQVVERGTGLPVAGAILEFEQQQRDNPFSRDDSRPNYARTQMNYATDADGHFRLPVWPGPGYLLVKAPTLDYVHVTVSEGEKWDGKPGLSRNYHDGALRLELAPGATPAPLKIELDRGVTLRRRVVRPDGEPASGTLHCRSYLVDAVEINGHTPPLPITGGSLELPGFEPEHSNPLLLLDLAHHCGAVVSPTAAETGLDAPPIELLPCGAAKFRFLNEAGEPLAKFEPRIQIVVTPGAPATHYIRSDQPLWSDTIIWQNMYWNTISRAKVPKTDADGRVVVSDLIPGATYNLSFVGKDRMWDEGFEFTVRPGETTDVGEVRLSTRE